VTFEAERPERCAWCGQPMDDTRRRRGRARLTCGNRCRKALSREAKRSRSSKSNQAGIVTAGDVLYSEPPRPSETRSHGSWRSDETFRRMLAAQAVRSQPPTAEERAAQDWERRNPGIRHPLFVARWAEADAERRSREQAEYGARQPLKVEDRLDPASLGSLARRARESRRINRAADQYTRMRPDGQPGPPSWSDNECVDAPEGRKRGQY